jgi:hypothetical protein
MIKRSIISSIALVLALAVPLSAHPTSGVLHLASKQVGIGGELVLRGERFERTTDLELELRGTLDNYPVGEVKTNTAGAFQVTLTLPPHVPAGAYTLVAIAPDGDITARVDMMIVPAEAAPMASTGKAGMKQMPGMQQQMPGEHATAEMMAVDQSQSPAERIIVAALVLLSFGGGATLLRKAAMERSDGTET